jgi:hypothetical protein
MEKSEKPEKPDKAEKPEKPEAGTEAEKPKAPEPGTEDEKPGAGAEETDTGTDEETDGGAEEETGTDEETDGGTEEETDTGTEEEELVDEELDDEPDVPSYWWAWLLGGLVLAGISALIIRRLMRRKPKVPASASTDQPREAAADEPATATATEAVVAAAEPTIDYDAEIAAMLHRSLRMLGWMPAGAQLARTAREVVRGVAFEDPRRAPAQAVVRVAEQVRFAGVAADVTLYEAAKAAFEQLTAAANPKPEPVAHTEAQP